MFLVCFLFIYPPVAPEVNLLSTGKNPALMEDFVQMICSATGDLPIKFGWNFNGDSIGVLNNVNVDGTRRSSTLTIESIDGHNAGNYTCTATNRGGKASGTVELIVKGGSSESFVLQFIFLLYFEFFGFSFMIYNL